MAAGSTNEVGTVGVPSTGNTTAGVAAVPLTGSCAVTTQTGTAPVLRKAAKVAISAAGTNMATAACCAAPTDSAVVDPATLKAMVCDMT